VILFFAKIVSGLTVIFLALSLAARVLGGTQPPNPVLRDFLRGCEGKAQPCWYGIIPGVTTVEEVGTLLAFAGEPELSRSIFSQDFALIFTPPSPSPSCRAIFDFVDGVAVRGEITLCRQPDIRTGDLALLLENELKLLSLPPNELVYGKVGVNVEGWPVPYSRVNYIGLLPPNARFQHFPWFGFISQRRYCNLVPSYPRCS